MLPPRRSHVVGAPVLRSATVAAFVALTTPYLLSAQSLQYQSTTKAEISGVVGKLISKMGGMDEPMVETTSIQGSKIRKDEKGTSQIMDWETGTLTLLDHKAKTFSRVTFAQTADAISAGMEQARAEEPAQPAAPTEEQQAGMAIVSDLRMSTDFPEQKLMEAMRGEALDRFRESVANGQLGSTMQAMSSYDPRVKAAWEKNADALKDLKGTALRSTIQFVTLPTGVSLDEKAVLAADDQRLGSDIDVAGAAAQGAADAAKKALGGLAGRFGRKKEEPKATEAPAPVPSVFLRTRTEIGSVVEDQTLPPGLFDMPADYVERPFDVPGGI